MSAYVIADIRITDPVTYEEYKKVSHLSVTAYGGRFLARGGRTEVLEGTWQPNRLVIAEFESVERAREWWASAEYRQPKALRQKSAVTNLIIVEGA